MNLATVLRLLPYLVRLMELAEKHFGDGTGEIKKALVMDGAAVIIDGLTEQSTGGQKSFWDRVGGFVGNIVDSLASILFPHDDEED